MKDPEREAYAPMVRKVLEDAARTGKRSFLTAYQILDRLPDAERAQLIAVHSAVGGLGAGTNDTATNAIAHILSNNLAEEVEEPAHFDARGAQFKVGDDKIESRDPALGLYRLKP